MAKKGFISESLYNDLSLRIVRQQNKLRQIKASSKYKEGAIPLSCKYETCYNKSKGEWK